MRLLLLIPMVIAFATLAVLLIRHYWIRILEAVRDREYWWLASRGAALLVLLIVTVALWYFGNQWWSGAPVDGDELLSLVNKPRTDPSVASVFRRLGYSKLATQSADAERTDWDQHGVSFWVNPRGDVSRIAIGDAHGRFFGSAGKPTSYTGKYPLSLLANDSPSEVRRKLGPPDDWDEKQLDRPTYWVYSNRKVAINFLDGKLVEVSAFAGD